LTIHSLEFIAFGLVARVIATDAELLLEAADGLPPGWRAHRAGSASVTFGITEDGEVTVNDATVAATGSRGRGLFVLSGTIRHHLAEHAPDHVFIHAGVVAVDGAGIVIPGRSMSGKSTLVHALVEAGATYLSDEYAVVDPSGMIHPYPKPISLRLDPLTWRFPPDASVPPEQIGKAPVPSRLIVATKFAPDATWRPDPLTAGEAALALIDNTVVARTRPGDSIAAATRLSGQALSLGGPRGDAAVTAAAILELVAGQGADLMPTRSVTHRPS
jgi:hypothetical protein